MMGYAHQQAYVAVAWTCKVNHVNRLAMGSGVAELRINYKDEKMYLKTMRTFFFLQAIVSWFI